MTQNLPIISYSDYQNAKYSNGFLMGGGISDFFRIMSVY